MLGFRILGLSACAAIVVVATPSLAADSGSSRDVLLALDAARPSALNDVSGGLRPVFAEVRSGSGAVVTSGSGLPSVFAEVRSGSGAVVTSGAGLPLRRVFGVGLGR